MKKNLKTSAFFLLLLAMALIPEYSEEIQEARKVFERESEDAREIYTGQIKPVYNPLDKAYIVTDTLKELIKKEEKLDFKRYKAWAVISLWVDPKDLDDEDRGIFANPMKKGRLWERASYVNYYENGEKEFSSYAGLRVHGGTNRIFKDKSLRLYFRKSYGEPQFLSRRGITLEPGAPVKRLVLRRDTIHRFTNDLGYSMVRKMGGLAPKLKPVAVFINGKLHEYMMMTEHLHRDQVRHFIGHDNFIFYKLKGDNPSEDHLLYERLKSRLSDTPQTLTFDRASSLYDIEGIFASALVIMYMAISDWEQGVIIKEQNDPNSKWRLISWDFDRALVPHRISRVKNQKHPWEMKSFELLLDRSVGSFRSKLFNRLLAESPEFKDFLIGKVDRMFKEDITSEFLMGKFAQYETLIKESGNHPELVDSLRTIKDFFANRRSVFCAQMMDRIGALPPSCSNRKGFGPASN